jgi:hypothetical protein
MSDDRLEPLPPAVSIGSDPATAYEALLADIRLLPPVTAYITRLKWNAIPRLRATPSSDERSPAPSAREPTAQSEPVRVDPVERTALWGERVKKAGTTDKALIAWAREKFPVGDDFPDRKALLTDHRTEFGKIRRISHRNMRPVRKALASAQAKAGGQPTHRLRSKP